MDWILIKRSMWLSTVAAGLALAACGDEPRVPTARKAERPVASPGNATPTDRATAESAAQRTDQGAGVPASEATLTAKVKSALLAEPSVSGMRIDVDTHGKRVTLSGEVDSPEHRQRAVQAARSVEGVEGVIDRLAVKRG